jgi:hypothetical protein
MAQICVMVRVEKRKRRFAAELFVFAAKYAIERSGVEQVRHYLPSLCVESMENIEQLTILEHHSTYTGRTKTSDSVALRNSPCRIRQVITR